MTLYDIGGSEGNVDAITFLIADNYWSFYTPLKRNDGRSKYHHELSESVPKTYQKSGLFRFSRFVGGVLHGGGGRWGRASVCFEGHEGL